MKNRATHATLTAAFIIASSVAAHCTPSHEGAMYLILILAACGALAAATLGE